MRLTALMLFTMVGGASLGFVVGHQAGEAAEYRRETQRQISEYCAAGSRAASRPFCVERFGPPYYRP